jgi:two-component system, LytTR family, response regulator LytT
MRIAIIEDEKPISDDLASTIQRIAPESQIVKVLHTVEDAIEYFIHNPEIDLIFSDIQLSDGLSFLIYEKTAHDIPIIFCTAYNEYALEAFNTAGIAYLLKPFSRDSVEKALAKYRSLQTNRSDIRPDYVGLIKQVQNASSRKSRAVIIRQGDKIIPLAEDLIALFFIEHENVYAYSFDKKKFLISESLDDLELIFAPSFFRVNRQFLVSRSAVRDAAHSFNRRVTVNLTFPFERSIEVGKVKVTAFIQWLAGY